MKRIIFLLIVCFICINSGFYQSALAATPDSCFDTAMDTNPDSITGIFNHNTTDQAITKYHIEKESCGKDVDIPTTINGKTITAIGNDAFSDLGITSIKLPNTIKTIEMGAFENNKLSQLIIPDSVNSILNVAFQNNQLTTVRLGKGVRSIGYAAFQNNKIKSVNIPNGLQTIWFRAFAHNKITGTITIPISVKTIAAGAFADNLISRLRINNTKILIDWHTQGYYDGDSYFDYFAFSANCLVRKKLDQKTVKILDTANFDNHKWEDMQNDDCTGKKVKKEYKNIIIIPESCFEFDKNSGTINGYSQKCSKELTIPSKINGVPVVNIRGGAFYNQQLTSVTLPNSIVSIGDRAFMDNKLTGLLIPDSVNSIGKEAFRRNKLSSIAIPVAVTENAKILSQSGIFYQTTGSGLRLLYSGNTSNLHIDIPSSINGIPVTNIGASAFQGDYILSVTIPNSITTIEASAFDENKILSVNIPSSVTSIGMNAFSHNGLSTVVLPNSISRIEAKAFHVNNISSVTIPNSVTYIGYQAFANNALSVLSIPDSVAYISQEAFKLNYLSRKDLDSLTLSKLDEFNSGWDSDYR